MAVVDTVAGRLCSVTDQFAILPDSLKTVTEFNGTLVELTGKDSVLTECFGEPRNDPIIEFEIQEFKQAVKDVVASSKKVEHSIKSIARYVSNADQVERITTDLKELHQPESCQKLTTFLTVVYQRVHNCHKSMENLELMCKKVKDLMSQGGHPSTQPTTTLTFPRFARMFTMKARLSIVGVTALAILCPVLIMLIQSSRRYSIPTKTELTGDTLGIRNDTYSVYAMIQRWIPSWRLYLYMLGYLFLGCAIPGTTYFCLGRLFRFHQQVNEHGVSPLSLQSTTDMSALQSERNLVHTFLQNIKSFQQRLLELEQSVKETANCQESGNICEIEEQLKTLQVKMHAVLY